MKLIQCIAKFFNKVNDISSGRKNLFKDLTPDDNADPDGNYANALYFALENTDINNIAITGPYGSGKSSIIKTFKKNSNYKFLNISLASFKEDDDNSAVMDLIERSILQQMLYGADANKLPYSRFKRISTPEHPLLKSLFLVLWVITSFLLYQFRNDLLWFADFYWYWVVCIFLFCFELSIPVIIISHFYKASFGVSLKKLSLKNAEIETGEHPENSILNRHLDEIIYFFQVTNYNVVVIEDLDRFNNPEIFVKLREINKLINDNKVNCVKIKFLYALKDDMFHHKNRTKFFDFIIPVVPIINSSNSLDKILVRLKDLSFQESIDKQFLREVSLYINDLRIIHNIFNEFIIYYEHLKSKSLDVTKLLAMMIYKNVYPDDFDDLHHGRGVLFKICKKKSEYQQVLKDKLKTEINELNILIKLADTEKSRSLRELISTYVYHIIIHSSQPTVGVFLNNQHVPFSELINPKQFEPLFSEKNIHLATNIQNNPSYRIPINKSFSQIEEEINPGETFLSRKENIENKPDSKKIELQQRIKKLEDKIDELSQMQLHKLLLINDFKIDDLINEKEKEDYTLLIYLVRYGYLDDNYNLYISNFHEGRLTKNDRDYLLTIRNFNQPDPKQKIDTPEEILANMREEDFGYMYVLNVTIIDYLLDNIESNSSRIKTAMHYISQNFEQSSDFFIAYFTTGIHLDKFIITLSQIWPSYVVSAITSKHSAEQISYILRFVESDYIIQNMNIDNVLTDFLSEHGHLVFASDLHLPEDYSILKKLNVHFHKLNLLEKNRDLLDFANMSSLYTISLENVNYILQNFVDSKNFISSKPEKANYTTILNSDNNYLKTYIEENLPVYIDKVFLTLPENTDEIETTIIILINHPMLDNDLRERIISKQAFIFSTFEGVPKNLWSYMLLEEKVVASWLNISEFLSSKDNEEDEDGVITDLLGRPNIVASLSNQKISKTVINEDASKSLSLFILNNDEINDSDYCKLIRCLPYRYNNFPMKVSHEKIKCLATEKIIMLTEKSFGFSNEDNELKGILISKNFDEYLSEKEKFPLNDDIREILLSSEIRNENKIFLCHDVTPQGVVDNKKLSRLIADVLVSNETDFSKIDNTVLSSAIVNAGETSDSIKLFIKCLSNWDEKKSMETLANLPVPYSEISQYSKRPKLINNDINFKLAKLLETKGFVSSVKEEEGMLKINTFNSIDHL